MSMTLAQSPAGVTGELLPRAVGGAITVVDRVVACGLNHFCRQTGAKAGGGGKV